MLPFKKLNISTQTVMVYSNIKFNFNNIFNNIYVTPINAVYTKKQKNIDKKSIICNFGSIISVQKEGKIRGLNLRKRKNIWCTICRPSEQTINGDYKKILSVREQTEQNGDMLVVKYYCEKCKKLYLAHEIKQISNFLNQCTCVFSINNSYCLNMMIFDTKIKIAGCKTYQDAEDAIKFLWEKIITPSLNTPQPFATISTPFVKFNFAVAMQNVKFKTPYKIERNNLNVLMNDEEYSDIVFMANYISTEGTSVNIKMYSSKPVDYEDPVLEFQCDERFITPELILEPEISGSGTKKPKQPVKKQRKQECTTIIVFSSGECIFSGRYLGVMEKSYIFFTDIILSKREMIEEKIKE